jgi:hypothetical protein
VTLANRAELEAVLDSGRLGPVFARHAYGMRAWVDLFAARIPDIADPEMVALVAGIVADNARHGVLFRSRAIAHGLDPDDYVCPPEGDAIYARLAEITDSDATLAYALGSLDHFAQLLAVYADAADEPEDLRVIQQITADNDRAREVIRVLVGDRAGDAAADAHELYRVRELAETPGYVNVC